MYIPDGGSQLRRPPTSVTSSLEKLNGDCSVIKEKFDTILSLPYLESLQVDNPFKTDSSGTEEDKIDIRTMIIRYQSVSADVVGQSLSITD